MTDAFKIGISSCLLGNKVRWNGTHKLDRFLAQTLGRHVEFVPVCPEVEAGFGVPRESMRLVGDPAAPRLITHRSGKDLTGPMTRWARKRVAELAEEDLCGFIFKCDSPSSGMVRVKVYSEKGMPRKVGVGLFARTFMEQLPLVPVEDDGRLHDPAIRENFIERVFTLRRWREVASRRPAQGNLVAFHTRNKLLLLSHSQKHYRAMGKLVAAGGKETVAGRYAEYQRLLMEALALKTTVAKHVNVLQHLMGYFKKMLSGDEKQELLEIFDRYRRGLVPLIVPVTLINHYVRKYDQPYLRQQTYLNPHPLDLKLRLQV